MLIDQACVDTGNTLCQFTLSFFSFWIMDNYIDWSTLSCDTTHLPRYFSLWERSCPLYLTYNACFPTSKNGVSYYNIVGVLWNFFRGNKLLRELKASVKKLMDAAKNTIPSLAKAMESLRAKMIIFCYQRISAKARVAFPNMLMPQILFWNAMRSWNRKSEKRAVSRNPFALKRKVPPFLMSKSRWSYLSALQN